MGNKYFDVECEMNAVLKIRANSAEDAKLKMQSWVKDTDLNRLTSNEDVTFKFIDGRGTVTNSGTPNYALDWGIWDAEGNLIPTGGSYELEVA